MKKRTGNCIFSIYGIAIALAIILMSVFVFVDIAGTSPKSKLDVPAAHQYIKDLSDEPHPYGYWNAQGDIIDNTLLSMLGYEVKSEDYQRAHEENRQYIVDELTSFGLGSATYTKQAADIKLRNNTVKKLFDGVENLSEDNALSIPDDKFPSALWGRYDESDPNYDMLIEFDKKEYVKQYLEASEKIESLKTRAENAEQHSDEYYVILEEARSCFNALYELDNNTIDLNNSMPQFGAQISPFVVEYDRYITNAESEEIYSLGEDYQPSDYEPDYVSTYVRNVIAYFPSKETIAKGNNTTADIVAFVCHYDSVNDGPGAVDDNASLGGLLSAAKSLASNYVAGENDICFIFTDAEEKGLWGIKSMYFLDSMGDFFNRLGLIFNFEGRGTSGTVAMFETSMNNRKLIGKYAASGANNTIYASSLATFIYGMLGNTTDMEFILDLEKKGLQDASVLNFANIGSAENYHTERDSYDNMTDSIPVQVGTVALMGISAFKDYDLAKLKSGGDAVFFSYYDLWIIAYGNVFGYILAIIGVLLLAAVIYFNLKKRGFSWKKLAKGAAVQGIAVLASVIVFFALGLVTYLIGRNTVLYDEGMFELFYTFSNIWIILAITAVAGAACYFVYKALAKVFKIDGADAVRGSNIIILTIGVVLSFALPSAGYLFMFPALIALAAMLAELLFKEKFERKTGRSWDILRLSTLPFILCIFLPLSLGLMVTEALGHIMYPVVGLVFALMLGTFLPSYRIKEQVKLIADGFKKGRKIPDPDSQTDTDNA